MKYTTQQVKDQFLNGLVGPMKDAAEEAFIDWLDQIVEDTYAQGSRSQQPDGYALGFEDGYAEGYREGYADGTVHNTNVYREV